MKLAEALIERANLKNDIESLRQRMIANAKAQEGVEPSEKPSDLLKELETKLERYEYLVVHINKTNSETIFEKTTIADMIAKRDCLRMKVSVIGNLSESGRALVDRYSRTEIAIKPTFDTNAIQKKCDTLAKECRELDAKIQGYNWITELK